MTVIGTTLLLIILGIYNHFNFLVCPYGLRCFIIVHFSLQYASVCSSLVGSNFQYPAHAYLAEETLHRSHPWSHVSLFIAQSHFWSLEKITAQHSSWSVLTHPFFFLYFPLQISAFSGQINLCFFTSTNASCFLAKIVTCILLLSWGTIPNPMRSSHLFKPNTHGDKVTLLWVGIMSLSSEQVALFVSVVVYCYAVFSPLFLKVAHTQGRSRKISIRRPGYPALRHD